MERSWRIGGPQGSGIETAAMLFARALALGGLSVLGRREYHSNIMGRHSYLEVRFGETPPLAFPGAADLLVALEAETLARHLGEVRPGGAVLYPPEVEGFRLSKLPFLDTRPREELAARLGEADPDIRMILDAFRQSGVETIPIPFEKYATQAGAALGLRPIAAKRATNTAAVASSLAYLGYPQDFLLEALTRQFSDKPEVLALNREVVATAYAQKLPKPPFEVPGLRVKKPRLFLTGSQAAALGKLAGGLSFQTYYPISPATDESFYLEAHPQGGATTVQVEDELAAVTMAIGAAMSGARAATATSGPGFSLMAEALGFAGITETPLVVTLYQRGGPSTGLPTRNEQGDLLFSIFAGHGEFPRIVIASGDLEEAFFDAAWSLELAQAYQTVVIHLLDKELASRFATVDEKALSTPEIQERKAGLEGSRPLPRFDLDAHVPLGTAGTHYWITSDEHDAFGHISEDPVVRRRMMERRAQKLARAAREVPDELKFHLYGRGEKILVGWGSVKGAARWATQRAGWRYLHLRWLWPFPEAVAEVLADAPFAVVEENQSGQLAELIRLASGRSPSLGVHKFTGRPIFGEELRRALEGAQGPRVVLMEGV